MTFFRSENHTDMEVKQQPGFHGYPLDLPALSSFPTDNQKEEGSRLSIPSTNKDELIQTWNRLRAEAANFSDFLGKLIAQYSLVEGKDGDGLKSYRLNVEWPESQPIALYIYPETQDVCVFNANGGTLFNVNMKSGKKMSGEGLHPKKKQIREFCLALCSKLRSQKEEKTSGTPQPKKRPRAKQDDEKTEQSMKTQGDDETQPVQKKKKQTDPEAFVDVSKAEFESEKLSTADFLKKLEENKTNDFSKRLTAAFGLGGECELAWEDAKQHYQLKLHYAQNVPFVEQTPGQDPTAKTSWIYNKELLYLNLEVKDEEAFKQTYRVDELTFYHGKNAALKAWFVVPLGGGNPVFGELRDVKQTSVKNHKNPTVLSGNSVNKLFKHLHRFFRPQLMEFIDAAKLTDEDESFWIPLRVGLDREDDKENDTMYFKSFDGVILKPGKFKTSNDGTLEQDEKKLLATKQKLKKVLIKDMVSMFQEREKELPKIITEEIKQLKLGIKNYFKLKNNMTEDQFIKDRGIWNKLFELSEKHKQGANLFYAYIKLRNYNNEYVKARVLLNLQTKYHKLIPDNPNLGNLYRSISLISKDVTKSDDERRIAFEDLKTLNKLIWDGIHLGERDADEGYRKTFTPGSRLEEFRQLAFDALWGGYVYQMPAPPEPMAMRP